MIIVILRKKIAVSNNNLVLKYRIKIKGNFNNLVSFLRLIGRNKTLRKTKREINLISSLRLMLLCDLFYHFLIIFYIQCTYNYYLNRKC